jgi:hypothetical protein
MGSLTRPAVTAAAAVAGAAVAGRLIASRQARAWRARTPKQHVITVCRAPGELPADLPAPLAGFGDSVEITLTAAPGGRGTEIAVRPVDPAVSDGAIRKALRISRSLLEVGYVLEPGVATTTPTLWNRPLRAATRHGREEGLL